MDVMTIEVATGRELTEEEHNEILDRAEEAAVDVLGLEPGEEMVVASV